MNDRVKKLREQSLQAINSVSPERAQLVTTFYKHHCAENDPIVIQRAQCFKYILENKKICILPDELIVGERGPQPKATPTYPEICIHSLTDLEIINNRPKVNFHVSQKTKEIYEKEIIPFWKNKTMREKLLSSMSKEWEMAYQAGIFTEFQEQRAPGHTVLGNQVYRKGLNGYIQDINLELAKVSNEHEVAELEAMKITAEALIHFASRHASHLQNLALLEKNTNRKKELLNMVKICEKVPAHKPETMHEMLQCYWFIHLGVITELNPWDSFNPGRIDQHLYPFYKKEIQKGTLTESRAKELLGCFWIKFNNHPSPPKMGVTALESNTYTDFSLLNLGGLTENGENAVNEMTYMLLDIIEEMRLLQPSSMIQVSKKNPDKFIERALKIIKTGFGQPSIFNTDEIVKALVRQGKAIHDARNGGASGCVESGAFGTESYVLTGYFNLTKILEITLYNGIDPRTNHQLGLRTGNIEEFRTFEQLMSAYKKQITYFATIKIEGNNRIEKQYATYLPVPFLSLFIADCISNHKDYNAKGARYNSAYIQGVGLGSVTDTLTAIRYHIYEKQSLSLEKLMHILESNFSEFEAIQNELLYYTPKYGNDDDFADEQAKQVFDIFFQAIDNNKKSPLGATYRINMLPTTCHVYFGSVIGATADGRLAGKPLSEGISPVQGMDKKGPTAALLSASKIDHVKTGGTLLNQKFAPDFFCSDLAIQKLVALIRGYFSLDAHHVQFNVIDKKTLLDAQKNPQAYQDLIVRVAGYSDYFNDLGEALQNEIIHRTEHRNC